MTSRSVPTYRPGAASSRGPRRGHTPRMGGTKDHLGALARTLPPHEARDEGGVRALYVLDPGGHLVELLTRPYVYAFANWQA
jgi:hypothetical protein